jgi:DNA polymerase elongation subunit (family B)
VKILTIDIETKPNVAHTWGLWKQDIGLAQLRQSGAVISFASKWHGKRTVEFYSDFHTGHDDMIHRAHALLSEADAVVHYNGNSFDMPWLRTEFVERGLLPPAPHKDIDLMRVVKKQFRFPSNKLAYVTKTLGLSGKMSHQGHQMWVDIMEGDEVTQTKAWNAMRRYNKQDVRTTEELFDYLRPWITGLPNPALYAEDGTPESCGCGNTDLQKRGFAYTGVSKYQRYQCAGDGGCGRWLRDGKRLAGVEKRGV